MSTGIQRLTQSSRPKLTCEDVPLLRSCPFIDHLAYRLAHGTTLPCPCRRCPGDHPLRTSSVVAPAPAAAYPETLRGRADSEGRCGAEAGYRGADRSAAR